MCTANTVHQGCQGGTNKSGMFFPFGRTSFLRFGKRNPRLKVCSFKGISRSVEQTKQQGRVMDQVQCQRT